MGLKNAAAYFQKVMAEEVLAGLVQHVCELYIDDCIIYADSEKELLKRIRTILQRCRDFNIIINPEKCVIGVTEIEILGHVINQEGIKFSKERLALVADIPLPTTGTKLLSFLGIINYLRDHIKDYASLTAPLRALATRFAGSKRITEWTTETTLAFEKAKEVVLGLQPLYFIDPTCEVFLHTDASNTGIGAYLFQVKDGKEFPIAFVSKPLKGAELNWSTFETEGYAIWYALKKLEYLLRDAKFVIRTDHRNLLYVNQAASPKVQRWKWDIQQYNFTVEHIPGRLNVVADGFSRLNTLRLHRKERQREESCAKPVQPHISKLLATMHTMAPLRVTRSMTQGTTAPGEQPPELAVDFEDDSDDEEVNSPPATVGEPAIYCRPVVQNTPTPLARQLRRPMPTEVRESIASIHNGVCGHHGVEKTLDLLKQRAQKTWTGMRADVKRFIRECPCCQFMNATALKASIAPFNVSAFYPMDRLNIDHIGPLPADEDGNRYILVIIDVFSRFVELYPVKSTSAMDFAKCLVNHIGRYGHPDEILTDNGSAFIAELTSHLMKMADAYHTTTLPYSHEENSIVERANKEVMRHLRAITFDKSVHGQWSLYLPLVQRILNVTPKETTGVAPARVIYGNNVDLDRGIFNSYQRHTTANMGDYLEELERGQARVIAVAQETQAILNAQHIAVKRRKNREQPTSYSVNEFVLLAHPRGGVTGKRQKPDKLSLEFKGPYRVTNVQGTRYSLQDLLTGKQLPTQHVSSLAPFIYDKAIVDPKEVAERAAREFTIEEIRDIRGTKRNRRFLRTDLEVQVHWAGYVDEDDTWEPYANVKLSRAFKKYCEAHQLEYLLPIDNELRKSYDDAEK